MFGRSSGGPRVGHRITPRHFSETSARIVVIFSVIEELAAMPAGAKSDKPRHHMFYFDCSWAFFIT